MTQAFGGRNTKIKLRAIENYIAAYQSILSKQELRTTYFDAFAGTGSVTISKTEAPLLPGLIDADEVIKGSAIRALGLERPFSRYIFVEKNKKKINMLKSELSSAFPDLQDRITFEQGDANSAIEHFCQSLKWNDRAVVFLDPFGNQVNWSTIEMLAKTEAIDLWYLFPSGLGVNRQISRNGKVHPSHVESLNRLLGTSEWPHAFLSQEPKRNLFGDIDDSTYKSAGAAEITKFIIERMKAIFAGGVSDEWVPLGSRNVNWYSLIFACANPRAGDIALRVAKWVIQKAQ